MLSRVLIDGIEILILLVASMAVSNYFIARKFTLRDEERLAREQESRKNEMDALRAQAELQIAASVKQAELDAEKRMAAYREELENEFRDIRSDHQRQEQRLELREQSLDRRIENLEKREENLSIAESQVNLAIHKAEKLLCLRKEQLENITGISLEEAKAQYLKLVEDESQQDAIRISREIEDSARRDAERKARNLVVAAIQRCSVQQTSETTVSVVAIPNEEMKGRLIGREGRNIRTFETITGVDLVIDDTPEAVVLSCFDSVRREKARIALTNLIIDGRIHPGRIEEIYQSAEEEVENRIREAGETAIQETGLAGIAPELVMILGRLKYRTSYGQNVLNHSIEVSHLCGLLAAELGAEVWIARRAGLLHDIGKATDHEMEGPHALITGELMRRYHENEAVVHAAESHHYDVEPKTIEAMIVICADQISASRPGARRDALESYVKRVRKLEEIGDSFPGVEKTFAVQAGREIRVLVKPDMVDDLKASQLAREISRRIEKEMEYPGQIKITVIRESRSVDYAK